MNDESTPTRRRLWAPERRRQLLDVAAQILRERGVDGIRLGDLAVAAGVTKPVVYRHFPNRQALIIELVKDYGEYLGNRFDEAFQPNRTSQTPLLDYIQVAFEVESERGHDLRRLLSSLGTDPEIEAVRREVYARVVLAPTEVIKTVTGLPEDDSRAVAAMCLSAGEAAVERWLAGELDRDRAIELTRRSVIAMVRELAKDWTGTS